MRVLVTGGAGFIGSNFIHYLLSLGDGYEVMNYDKLTYAGNLANLEDVAAHPHYEFVRADICNARAVWEAMQGCDAVVHFAAESHVDRSIFQPNAFARTNVAGTLVLLQVARKLGVRKFVHVSTDEVYGDLPPGQSAKEDWPLRPSSPYAASKAASDLLVGSFVRTYSFPAVITRSSNNYGPYQFPEKFIPLMISNALEDRALPVYGDGLQERDWIHVEDHCRGILAVLERGETGSVYNIGGGNTRKNLDMARLVLGMLGKPESLLSFVQDRPGHDRRYSLDWGRISGALGWQPRIALEEGLKQTVEWYRRNGEWLSALRSREYLGYYARYYERRAETLASLNP